MEYRHLNKDGVNRWVSKLLSSKGSIYQEDFLEQVAKNEADKFVAYVEKSIAEKDGKEYDPDGDIPSLLNASGRPVISMTPGHMYLMPAKDILKLYQHWRNIPFAEATCPTFWGAITLEEIRETRIQPVWLAVSQKCDDGYAQKEIDNALKGKDAKKIDRLVRRCLRWMMGPGHMRGAPEMYGNCSLAKAWWCGHLAHECCEQEEIDVPIEKVVEVFKTVWLGMSDYLAGKLTVIGEPSVLAGISLWGQSQLSEQSGIPRTSIEEICRGLGRLSSWCVLGLKEPEEINRAIQEMQAEMARQT